MSQSPKLLQVSMTEIEVLRQNVERSVILIGWTLEWFSLNVLSFTMYY